MMKRIHSNIIIWICICAVLVLLILGVHGFILLTQRFVHLLDFQVAEDNSKVIFQGITEDILGRRKVNIYLLDLVTEKAKRLRLKGTNMFQKLSQDGTKVLFQNTMRTRRATVCQMSILNIHKNSEEWIAPCGQSILLRRGIFRRRGTSTGMFYYYYPLGWYSNDERIVFTTRKLLSKKHSLWTFDLKSHQKMCLLTGVRIWEGVMSPDRRNIYLVVSDNSKSGVGVGRDILEVSLDGSERRYLTQGMNCGSLSVSPKEGNLLFINFTSIYGGDIYIIDKSTSKITQLTKSKEFGKAKWYPQGQRILCSSSWKNKVHKLYTINLSVKPLEIRQLAGVETTGAFFFFRLLGKDKIGFTKRGDEREKIWCVDIEGYEETLLFP